MNFLFVALGGAVGAMARYAISLIPLKTEYPRIWFCFGRPAYAVALPRFLHFRWNPIICLNIITACLDADMWC